MLRFIQFREDIDNIQVFTDMTSISSSKMKNVYFMRGNTINIIKIFSFDEMNAMHIDFCFLLQNLKTQQL